MNVSDLVAVKFGIYCGCAVRITDQHVHARFHSQFVGCLENAPGFQAVIVDGPPAYIGRKLRLPVQYFQPIPYAAALEAFLADRGTPARDTDYAIALADGMLDS